MKMKEILETKEVKFTIKNIVDFNNEPKVFRTNHMGGTIPLSSIIEIRFRDAMNVSKFSENYMWLYTYDMLGNKTQSKVKYSDITLIEEAAN
jgi:hypothetical protein